MPQRVRRLWVEQPGLQRGYFGDLALAGLFGGFVVVGGRDRTGAAAWAFVNANGGPALWGTFLLVGALALCAVPWLGRVEAMWAMWLLAFLYVVLGVAFASTFPDGESSAAGALMCFYVAYNHISRAQAYKDGPRGPIDDP